MTKVPIIFGWGKKGKKIGYVGIDKCQNCKHYVHFSIYEYSNRVNIYFVPVVKFNKKHYLVCPVCDAAYELTGDLKEYYFDEMFNSMNAEISQDIFSTSLEIIESNFEFKISENNELDAVKTINSLIDICIEKLDVKYHNKKYIDKVARTALKYVFDDDKPN